MEGWDDELLEKIDAWIEESRQMFATLVSMGRNIPVEDILATEGDWFSGPDALELGLIDAIASPDAMFEVIRDETR